MLLKMLLLPWMIVKHLVILKLKILKESGDVIYPLANRAFGRVLAADVKDPVTGELFFKQGMLLAEKILLVLLIQQFQNY